MMRAEDEIRKVHDILVGLIIYPDFFTCLFPGIDDAEAMQATMQHCADVLCWVLGHEHNPAFGNNLAALEGLIASLGIKIVQHPEMQYPTRRQP